MEVLGRMAAGVSRLQQPRTVILSYTGMLEKSVAASWKATGPDVADLEEIRKASERAAALHAAARASAGATSSPPRSSTSAPRSASSAACSSACSARSGPSPSLWPARRVRCGSAPATSDQPLVNLVINARDATRAGVRVVIATATLEAGDDDGGHLDLPPGPRVVMTVRDDGSGMDDARGRGSSSRSSPPSRRASAPAWASPIVYGIVRQAERRHRRRQPAWAAAPPSGSTSRATRSRCRAGRRRRPRRQTREPGGETILLVEDSEPVRRLVLRVLGAAGYSRARGRRRGRGAAELRAQRRRDRPARYRPGDAVDHRRQPGPAGRGAAPACARPVHQQLVRARPAGPPPSSTPPPASSPSRSPARPLVGLVRRILDGEEWRPAAS